MPQTVESLIPMSSREYHVTVSEQAREDFRDIISYTVQMWGEAQASLYGETINQAITALAVQPLSGKSDLAPYRYIRAGKHMLFYRMDGHSVIISRILHGKMDFSRHLA
jgi:toxin ParE1/3/4